MSDFLKIFTHGRRLQAAVKELSIAELEEVAQKLNIIISKRQDEELANQAKEEERKAKVEAIRQQLAEAGLDIEDLQQSEPEKSKRVGKKRPVKYKIIDAEGEEHPWTGIGRMPRVFAAAIEAGKSLEEFKI